MNRRLVLVLAFAAGATMLTTTPATAESVITMDHRKDVWNATYNDSGVVTDWTKIGSVDNMNLVSTSARHQPKRLVIVARYDDLRTDAKVFFANLRHRIRTDTGKLFDATVTYGIRPYHDLRLTDAKTSDEIACEGLQRQVDHRRETIKVVIPRRCLGRPETVSVNTIATGETDAGHHYKEVGDGPGHGPGGWTSTLKPG